MLSKIEGWVQQRKISNEMKRIRENNGYGNINKTLKEIEEHYEKTDYRNKDLFYRLSELEIRVKIYEMYISSLIGLLLGVIVVEKSEGIDIVVLILTSLTMAFLVSLTVSFILKLMSNAKKGYEQYLNEKEMEIIKSIIECDGKG